MRSNIIFFVLGWILLLTAALFDVNFLDNKDPIPFDQWKTITFYDFKGLKKPGNTLDGVAEFAYIKTSRKINYTGRDARITAYFYPSRSYVFDQQIRNPDLLRHELYHFFITEYFTRLLRKEIKTYDGKITRSFIAELNKEYYRLENEMQDQYDEETYHSYVMKAQQKWETFLDNSLSLLAGFADPDVSLKK